MSRSSAWSIKGVDFDAREAAREAAARAGLSLGDWLNEVISEQAQEIGVDEQDFDEDDRREAVSARLRRMRGDKPEKFHMRADRAKTRRRQSAPIDREASVYERKIDRYDSAHYDNDEIAPRARRSSSKRADDGRAEQLLERALEDFDRRSERANRRAERAVADMAQMLESAQERAQYGEEALEAVGDKLAALERRLAQQNQREEERRGQETARERKARKQSYAGLRELDEKLSEIGKKLEGKEEDANPERSDRLARLERRLAAMSAKLEPARPAPAPFEPTRAAHDDLARPGAALDFSQSRRSFHDSIAEITARQRHLDNIRQSDAAPAGAISARPPAPFDVRQTAPVSPLEARLAGLIERLDEKLASAPSAQPQDGSAQAQAGAAPAQLEAYQRLEGDISRLAAQFEKMREDLLIKQSAPQDAFASSAVSGLQKDLHRMCAQFEKMREDLLIKQSAPQDAFASSAVSGLQKDLHRMCAQFEKMREDLLVKQAAPQDAFAATAVSGLQKDLQRMCAQFEKMREDVLTKQAAPQDFSGLDGALAQIRQEMAIVARALGELAPRASVSALERTMQELARQVQYAREHGVREISLAPLEQLVRELRESVSGLDARPAVASLERELRAVTQKIDSLEKRGGADPQTLQAILDQTRDVHDLLRRAATAMPSAITEKAIAALVARIDQSAQQGMSAPELSRLIGEVRKVGADGDATQALRALEARMDALARRIDQALAHSPAHELDKRLETLQRSIEKSLFDDRRDARANVSQIESAVADLAAKFDKAPDHRRIDEFGARLESLQRTIENSLRQDPGAAPSAARIESAVAELAAKMANAPDMRRMEEFGERLDMLQRAVAQSLNAPRVNAGPDVRQLEAMVSDLALKMERAADPQADRAAVESLERQIEKLAAKIETSQNQTAPLASLQQAITDIFAELEQTKRIALEGAERAAQEAAERVARTAESAVQSNATVAANVEQAAALAARQATAEVMAVLEANHGGDPVLARELAHLKDSQGASDKRTHSTLLSVHQTLEKIVERLGSLEDDLASAANSANAHSVDGGRARGGEFAPAASNALLQAIQAPAGEALIAAERGPKAKIQPSLKDAARAKNASNGALSDDDMVLIEPGSGFHRDGRVASAPVRDDGKEEGGAGPAAFIAAARRAMQATQTAHAAQANAPLRGEAVRPEINDQASIADGLLAKIKAQYERRKRPILLSLAAIVVLIGALQVVGVMTNGAEKAAPPAPKVENKQRTSEAAPVPAPMPAGKPARDVSKEPRGGENGADESSSANIAASPPENGGPSLTAPPQAPRAQSASEPQGVGAVQIPSSGSLGILPASPSMAPRVASPQSVAPNGALPSMIAPPQSVAPNGALPSMIAPPKRAAGVDGQTVSSINRTDPQTILALKTLAARGDGAAQYELGVRYSEGLDGQPDLKGAAQLFEKAALKGVAPAQYRLGVIYERGLGVAKNWETARQWYMKAAERGNARSMHNLAVMAADGNGKPNYADAAIWFRKAAERGLRDSQYNLAILYARGMGAPQDMVESYTWFAIASDQGDQEATRKRDDVGARLDPKMLARAKENVAAFKPTPLDKSANEVTPPPGGWQAAADPNRAASAPARAKATNL